MICVDRQSRIQTLDRPQPHSLIDLGGVEGYTHDYLCHGTKTLCAALDVDTGKGSAKPEPRHQGFLTFLRLIDTEVPKDLDLHLVLDNHATHQHAAVEAWLAERPRSALHAGVPVVAERSGTLVRTARREGIEMRWEP